MYHFILYLNPQGQQILNDLISARVIIKENYEFCRNRDVFGYSDKPRILTICTKNIENSKFDPYYYVNETLYHEAVHIAQNCKMTNILGIPKINMPLPPNKLQDVQNSMIASNNYSAGMREHEAYYLEDKPTIVRYYIKKFCF
ncbi:MAG: hypothetical protein EBS34_11050 [Flavobacteriales bacterium]|nr:hypothetical protein [Flavobacteriales bacterium]